MKVFVSYKFERDPHKHYNRFVWRVCYHLKRQAGLEPYCCLQADPEWKREVAPKLKAAEKLVFFVGTELGDYQLEEAGAFATRVGNHLRQRALCIRMPEGVRLEDLPTPADGGEEGSQHTFSYDSCLRHAVQGLTEDDALKCAEFITRQLQSGHAWIPPDGLPLGYPFDYEKTIIEEFVKGGGHLGEGKRIVGGCPLDWPEVPRVDLYTVPEAPAKAPVLRQWYTMPDLPGEVGADRLEDRIGSNRDPAAQIIVDARSKYHRPPAVHGEAPSAARPCLTGLGLSFPEAGPRKDLVYPARPRGILKVGIVVSGGIAPGINAVIEGIVQRHELYREQYSERLHRTYTLEIRGYRDGFAGVVSGANAYHELKAADCRLSADLGGSMLGTSRYRGLLDPESPDPVASSKALDEVIRKLHADQVDILYVIGGDGSMRAAHAIRVRSEHQRQADPLLRELSVVGIPKTMDNDILWVWQSFGFLSAVEKAREFVNQLHTEVSSNPRLCIVQLFGSDSGFVVSHAALASGVCQLALIPESQFRMSEVSAYVCDYLKANLVSGTKGRSPCGIILMAETAIPQDIDAYMHGKGVGLTDEETRAVTEFVERDGSSDTKRRVKGQTPDALRTAGLKVMHQVLQRDIRAMADTEQDDYWRDFRVFTNEPRHLLRSVSPSVQDVIFAERLGCLAVDNAMAGYTDFMISQWLTEYVLVPLELVVLGRKRIPPGIFWKTVVAKTGQPAKLAEVSDRDDEGDAGGDA
jgi:6-phosphofructokinase 1